MGKLRRGGYFTDIHFGKKANSVTHNQDCLNFIDWFCDKVVENKCDYVAFLGDWNENRSALNIQTLSMAYEGARKLNEIGLPVYFVIGNHDLYYRNSRDIHSVIHHSEFDNFTLIETPTVVDEIEGSMLFCPYMFHEEYPALTEYLHIPFWAGHFEFKGFIVTGYNITMPTGPDAADFAGPKHIVSGHFHKRQTHEETNVIYIGNAFPMDFGDAGDSERGMMVYDHIEDEMWFENWEQCPKYVKTRLSTLVEDRSVREEILVPQSRVNCLVDIPIEFEESTFLKQKFMQDYNLRELVLEESPELKTALADTEIEIDWENTELQTVGELVLHMLQEISTEHIDNQLLLELFKNIKTEDSRSMPASHGGPIHFISLTMKNFMSYGNNTTVVDLHRNGTTLILGEDLDNTSGGAGANGVGKTVIINALAYAVYGKAISNISKDNLVNNVNKKNMEVTVTFEKDGTYYHIQRVRKSKNYAAGNYVKYYVKEGSTEFTEDDEKTRDSVSNTNRVIERVVGIPHELFCRIVVFSALHTPFLDLPIRHPTQACQTRIIEELFDLTSLTERGEVLKEQIKENEQALEMKQARVDLLEREHARHEKQIDSAKSRVVNWQQTNSQQIDDLKAKLDKITGVDIDEQQKAHEALVELDREINTVISDQREITTVLRQMERDIRKKEKELEHLVDDKCPYCLQKYPDADNKVNEIDKELSEKRAHATAFNEGVKELEEEAEEIAKRRAEIEGTITVSNLDELVEIKGQSSKIAGRIRELKKATNPFIEPLEELEEIELEPINKDEINDIVRVIDHQKFLHKLLTGKKSFVRKVLLNKNIPFLNGKLQQYLSELGLPHTVEFTHELTAQISQFGHPLDFGNLSNGQRARVNLALSLAFRDVLQNLHTKINVCMFDEVLDVGLDAIGVQSAARMLKRKGRDEKLSLYIISHRDEIDKAFDHTMTVQLTGGFSFIKED